MITDDIEKVHQIIVDDRQIKIREIAETIGILEKRIYHMNSLDKLAVRWVPRLLTVDQKMFE